MRSRSQGRSVSRSGRLKPSKSMSPSQGPLPKSRAGLPRMRVPGPGAPAAAQAPAVTESILAQVVVTSSGSIVTSRGPRALALQAKNPGLPAVRQ